jgi:hypothetical protein
MTNTVFQASVNWDLPNTEIFQSNDVASVKTGEQVIKGCAYSVYMENKEYF